MHRRDFFKLGAGLGVVTLAPFALEREIAARLTGESDPSTAEPYMGDLVVTVNAFGGIDQTMFCDPWPHLVDSLSEADIKEVGTLRYMATPANDAFFTRFGANTVAINGIDFETNNHNSGIRASLTGKLQTGFPNVAALVAASHGPQLPMAFFGRRTAGVISPSRADAGPWLTPLMEPHRTNPGSLNPNFQATWQDASVTALVEEARAARLTVLRDAQILPRPQGKLAALTIANESAPQILRLKDKLPAEFESDPGRRALQFIAASFAAGISVGANIDSGGFDTHDSNDPTQITAMASLLSLVEFLYDEAERHEVADRLTVVIGTDFGRNPVYNERDRGKDHWSVGSMVVTGPKINGGRSVGTSDEGLMPVPLNPETLEADYDGEVLKIKHVHKAIRDLLGVSPELDQRFDLRVDNMPAGILA